MMKALTFHAHGGPDVLRYEEVPVPTPGPGEVRIRVKAVALNRLDLFVREGWPGLKLEMPHIGGCDAAGIVDALGPNVQGPAVGTRVVVDASLGCGRCRECERDERSLCAEFRVWGEHTRGGAAEYAIVPADHLLPIPDRVSFEEAAAAGLVYTTAWRMLITRAQLRAGETVLIV
ncbi:MAG TPA: alcohol dehydrogenase catalytic domain-containing protein, partial [Candidatus Thermoplasmatota archaeon]|nr:alcohol dehydrogenase catalytic domain-containing protein [Candidatus Thermoplasmatota archaeon]